MARSYTVEWNPVARRYAFRTASGGYGFLSEAKVRGIVDNDIDVAGARMGKIGDTLKTAAQSFKDGQIEQAAYNDAVRDYRDAMAAQIKGAHLGQAAAAVGGFAQMTAADYGRTGGLLGVQYRYLENACAEFAANPDLVLGNVAGRQSIEERSTAYAEASRATFERCADIANGENGAGWVVSILEAGAAHCAPLKGDPLSSCPAQAALGVVRYDDARRLVPGRRACATRCKCTTARFKTKKAALAANGVLP